MAFLIYRFLPIYLSIPLVAAVIILSLALAFYKMNNKPFIDILEAAFLYYTKQKKKLFVYLVHLVCLRLLFLFLQSINI
jgi:hypothetical protein